MTSSIFSTGPPNRGFRERFLSRQKIRGARFGGKEAAKDKVAAARVAARRKSVLAAGDRRAGTIRKPTKAQRTAASIRALKRRIKTQGASSATGTQKRKLERALKALK